MGTVKVVTSKMPLRQRILVVWGMIRGRNILFLNVKGHELEIHGWKTVVKNKQNTIAKMSAALMYLGYIWDFSKNEPNPLIPAPLSESDLNARAVRIRAALASNVESKS